MLNGAGLNPSLYTNSWQPDGLAIYQANLIIPKVGHPNQYYLFHNTIDHIPAFTTQYLYVTEIDMTNGLGQVTTKNQVLINGDVQAGHLTAVKHANGLDWWVYAHESNTNVFWRFLITPAGIQGPFNQSIGAIRHPDAGQVVFSKDGTRFAYYSGETGLDIFNVDRCTGDFFLTNHLTFDNDDFGIGASFSPSGKFLYISAEFNLYQVNLDNSLSQPQINHLAEWDSTYSPSFPFATVFGASKLAPDGKIYISTMNSSDKLHIINNPDSVVCGFVPQGLSLPTIFYNSIPNHPNYHLGALVGSGCDTLQTGIEEQSSEFMLQLYPNPNTGQFQLALSPSNTATQLVVYDAKGKLAHTQNMSPWVSSVSVALPESAPGLYMVQLNQVNGMPLGSVRFMIER